MSPLLGVPSHDGEGEGMRVYVAGPYTSAPEANTREAMEIGRQLLAAGHAPYIPHLSHYLDLYIEETTGKRLPAQTYYDLDFVWLKQCEAIVLFGDWEQSKGAVAEYHFAIRHEIHIYYWRYHAKELLR